MRSIRTTIVAIVAVAGFSALATSSAFAAPEWYAKKAGVYAKITKAVKVESKATIEVSEETIIGHELGQGPVIIACADRTSGSVGPGGAGEIATMTVESCKCTIEWSTIKNNCTLQGGVGIFNLVWSTELYSEGSEIRSKIVNGKGGLPGLEWKYKNNGVGEEKLTCNFNTNTHMSNDATTGGVEAEFDKKSNKTTCEQGAKAETAEWKGDMKIVPTESEKKAGIEAIKVE